MDRCDVKHLIQLEEVCLDCGLRCRVEELRDHMRICGGGPSRGSGSGSSSSRARIRGGNDSRSDRSRSPRSRASLDATPQVGLKISCCIIVVSGVWGEGGAVAGKRFQSSG